MQYQMIMSALSQWNEHVRKDVSLDRTALLMARTLQYPSLDVEEQMRMMDTMAYELKEYVGTRERATEIINAMNEFIFVKHGYSGNSDDYYDPRNSYLNDVIRRKKGIPITLSVLYMELARRIGFQLYGVGFPGHFLIKYVRDDLEIVIDPFSKGRILSYDDYQIILDQLYNGQIRFEKKFLEPVSNDQIIIRMLRNLKDTFVYSYDYDRALLSTEMILAIRPDIAEEFRDMGIILYYKKLYSSAISNLTKYLEMQPDATDADRITQIIRDMQSIFRHDMYR
jgi:regulator of sirC expression with transglutaminase-like and TPR domain